MLQRIFAFSTMISLSVTFIVFDVILVWTLKNLDVVLAENSFAFCTLFQPAKFTFTKV